MAPLWSVVFALMMSQQTQTLPDYPSADLKVLGHSEWTREHYPSKIAEFRKDPLKKGEVVFVGDSITEQGGDWSKKTKLANARNRGISGDVSEGVLRRLGEIVRAEPKAVFLLIGINDIFSEVIPAETIAANILKIAQTIHEHSPHTKVYIQTVLPTSHEHIKDKISKVNEIVSKSKSSAFTLIDLHAAFANEADLMKPELSHDGVHLTPKGYETWVKAIESYLS